MRWILSCRACVGLFTVELVPSPKVHFHEVGEPVLLSVKATLNGTFPDVGDAENTVTGVSEADVTFIYWNLVLVLLPAALVAVSATV